MNGASYKCPNPQCGCPVQAADRFCPFCGEALPGKAPESIREFPSPTVPCPAPVNSEQNVQSQLKAVLGRTEFGTEPRELTGTSSSSSLASDAAPSGCADMEVLYNNSCVFVLNMQSTFDFDIRPRVDGLRELFIQVRLSGKVIASEKPLVILKRGTPLRLSLNYTPHDTHAGKASFTILIGYRKEGKPRLFAAYRTHTIYSGKEDVRQVCESLVVEIKNNIQQGHAGDLRVDQNFRDLREALHQRTSIELDRDFLGLINARPFWAPLNLDECAPDAPTIASAGVDLRPAPGSPLPSFRLEGPEGLHVWLLTDSMIRIGRRRDCAVIARVLGESGEELERPSLIISMFHARIEWHNDLCVFRDGGDYPGIGWKPSKCGVWVDGKRIPSGSELQLAPGRDYRIALGKDRPEPSDRFASDTYALNARLYMIREMPLLPQACSMFQARPEAPACLVLRRLQGPPWVYLSIRSCASLGWADARCGRACVCIGQGEIQFSDGHLCQSLAPGQTIRAGSVHFRVVESGRDRNAAQKQSPA